MISRLALLSWAGPARIDDSLQAERKLICSTVRNSSAEKNECARPHVLTALVCSVCIYGMQACFVPHLSGSEMPSLVKSGQAGIIAPTHEPKTPVAAPAPTP